VFLQQIARKDFVAKCKFYILKKKMNIVCTILFDILVLESNASKPDYWISSNLTKIKREKKKRKKKEIRKKKLSLI
jgi:hypothetical protein